MGRYCDWAEVSGRYPEIAKSKDSTEVASGYIFFAEADIDSRLASRFTVPFSSNNVTAKDLAIDLTYLKVYQFKDPEKAKLIEESINARIDRLLAGGSSMMTTSGDTLTSVGGTVYSTTGNYAPTFGMGNVEDFLVNSAQLQDEADSRL